MRIQGNTPSTFFGTEDARCQKFDLFPKRLFNLQDELPNNMLQVLEALTAGAAFLLAFLILTNPRGVNKRANFWLGIFMASIAIQLLDTQFVTHGVYWSFPHLIGTADLGFFLFPPAIYFAALFFVNPQRSYRRTDFLHFFFFITYVLLNIPMLLALSREEKLKMIAEEPMGTGDRIALGAIVVYTLTYCGLSLVKLNRHQKNVAQIHASEEKAGLSWFRLFLVWVFILAALWVGYALFQIEFLNYLVTGGLLLALFFLGYSSLHQGEVYNFSSKEKEEIQEWIEEAESGTFTKKTPVPLERLGELSRQLEAVMEKEKPYLENDLNLLKLADRLEVNLHTLSFVINEGFRENFAQYINRHRVEEAKKLLEDPGNDHFSMVGIAFTAGFNSKTAFNTAFKKMTGVSPTDFKARRSVL